jgi:hypothetical protein
MDMELNIARSNEEMMTNHHRRSVTTARLALIVVLSLGVLVSSVKPGRAAEGDASAGAVVKTVSPERTVAGNPVRPRWMRSWDHTGHIHAGFEWLSVGRRRDLSFSRMWRQQLYREHVHYHVAERKWQWDGGLVLRCRLRVHL